MIPPLKRLSTVIVDDETLAVNNLKMMLEKFCPEVEVLGCAMDAGAAFSLIQSTQPELVFLDIEMPGKNGFELLDALAAKTFDVVFYTGHGHYAIKAVRYAALDYLLKPVDPLDLKQVVARKLLRDEQPIGKRFELMRSALDQPFPETIALPTLNGHIFKRVADITRIEAVDNYTRVHFLKEQTVMVSRTLKVFQDILPEQQFHRLHRSHLVRRSFIRELQRTKKPTVILADGQSIPVSLDKREDIFQNFLRL